jgi:hypothetical protein
MSEFFADPSPCNSDDEDSKILDITMFVTQPFSARIDMSKPVFVYFGSSYAELRNRETSANITWIWADQHDAYQHCLCQSKTYVCVVDPSFQTFRSLI